jgi:hypothetical protein
VVDVFEGERVRALDRGTLHLSRRWAHAERLAFVVNSLVNWKPFPVLPAASPFSRLFFLLLQPWSFFCSDKVIKEIIISYSCFL